MRRKLAIALITALALAPPAAASTRLTLTAAEHALRVDLARGFGIHHVHAGCHRRSRTKFSCSWRGVRHGTRYRGRATVVKSGRSISVQLSHVRRA